MCYYPRHRKTQASNGFSTIEILIAFSVGILFLTAAILVSYSDPALNRQMISLDSNPATVIDAILDNNALATSSNKLGNAVATLMADWDADVDDTTANPLDPTNLALDATVTDISPCLKEIINTTNWDTIGNRSREIVFGTALSDIAVAEALGRGGCDPFPPGEWDNPENTGWSVTPSSFTGKGTGIDVALIDGKAYAVITGENPGAGKNDLIIVDITDPADLSITSQSDLSPNGYNDVVVAGTYAYATHNDTTTHVDIINISDPSSPGLTASIVLPQAPTAKARSLAWYNDLLLIGTQYLACPGTCTATQNNEFHVYDVTNPATPTHLDSLNINHNINDIFVKDQIAYLATSDNTGELMLVDISNPSSLEHPDTSGRKFNPTGNQDGTSIYVLGEYAYLGRQRATNPHFDFYKIDISDPDILTATKWKRLNLSGSNSAVLDLHVQGRLAFLITSDSNSTFQVWDISTSPGNTITAVSSCSNILNLNVSSGLAYHEQRLFVVNENQATLNVIHDNPNACTP